MQLVLNPIDGFHLQPKIPRESDLAVRSLLTEKLPPTFQDHAIHFSMTTRRDVGLLALIALIPMVPSAAHGEEDPQILKITVTLGSRVNDGSASSSASSSGAAAALYITARPIATDNVPRAILDGSRGKPPPVLIARFPNVSTFPHVAILTAKDVTVEGNDDVLIDQGMSTNYWWKGQGLIVSARWDTDGVAATRDPTDLVGRAVWLPAKGEGGDNQVNVELQGRGAAGKFFTAKKP